LRADRRQRRQHLQAPDAPDRPGRPGRGPALRPQRRPQPACRADRRRHRRVDRPAPPGAGAGSPQGRPRTGRLSLHRRGHREGPALRGAAHDRAGRDLRRPPQGARRVAQAQPHPGAHRPGRPAPGRTHRRRTGRARPHRGAAPGPARARNHLMSKRVYIQEVATRDGFQIESRFIPTADKIALIDQLSATGLAKIEVTSFTSPKAIPNLRDAEEVMRGIRRVPGVVYTVLVPNEKGCERALACGVDEINLVMSASDTHGLANLRMTPEQSLAQFRAIIEATRGADVAINASLSTTFGCPFEGAVPEARVLALIQELLEIGV